ncbi:hypothetical protein LNV08_21985 [Paucibacter sp. TC2R-5]|uniref:hypothetical protein n=1 Tax=Paucibacter sp. TC2R-5 TaxID=2893555 RepID=UPI0021E41858|nr:hypothetical protein [Paucibacter sp. TC2R-5]MCV2361644.1 hypothetical protein [Paucibacter sp. TC2R-5]
MRYTINLIGQDDPATIKAEAGRVLFNGRAILPFEAAMLGDALNECADQAETLAAQAAAALQPVEA